ncbi:MAG: hypothetical protein U1E53_23220 [Dongiaceae bacterium]
MGDLVHEEKSDQDFHIFYYMPRGQSLQKWTDNLTLGVTGRGPTSDGLSYFIDQIRDAFSNALQAILEPLKISSSETTRAPWSFCGKARGEQSGWEVYRVILGKTALYLLERMGFPPKERWAMSRLPGSRGALALCETYSVSGRQVSSNARAVELPPRRLGTVARSSSTRRCRMVDLGRIASRMEFLEYVPDGRELDRHAHGHGWRPDRH